MLTAYEWAKARLESYGMWPDTADAVIERIKQEKSARGISWSNPLDGYPVQFYAALMLTLADCALDWIDENQPKAFYRPLFEEIVNPPLDNAAAPCYNGSAQ